MTGCRLAQTCCIPPAAQARSADAGSTQSARWLGGKPLEALSTEEARQQPTPADAVKQVPEHKFPAAHEDAFAAYQWALGNARSLNGDPALVAVVGESAGGNMAAAVSMMARQQNIQMPVYQVLVYSVANYGFHTPSYQQNANAKPLYKAMMQWFFDKDMKCPVDGETPGSLWCAQDLKGLPPATVITAEIDPLRSEGKCTWIGGAKPGCVSTTRTTTA